MGNLRTSYMGISLANPIVAGASDLTSNVDSIKRIEEAGAGALVLKSLFEEQIQLERMKLEEDLNRGTELYAEMASIFPKLQHAGSKEHLMWVKKAREAVKIPVFASLNAVSRETWVEYAKQLADQGVNGLELNFFATPRDFDVTGHGGGGGAAGGGAGGQAAGPHPRRGEAQRLLLQPPAHVSARQGGSERVRALQPLLPARHQRGQPNP